MGCVSSKILTKSGSFQEKVSCSLGHSSFQRSSAIEEMILSTSKSNGDQFLALLRTSTSSSVRKAKQEPEAPAAAVAEPAAKIETIHVSELLAGLEEEESCTCTAEEDARERRQSISRDGSPAPSPASAGRGRSFRTVEEFDAMLLLTQQTQSESGSSSGRATALATEQEELATATASSSSATVSTVEAELSLSGGSVGSKAAAVGAKRRARARQLGELSVPAAAFDFSISKSGSLRDWLRQGGQIFSPGSYVTPRFGTSPPPTEIGGAVAGKQQQQQVVFDPELVAQFERAMEQLSEDEGRVLDEILDALELEAAEKDGATVVGKLGGDDQPAAEPVLVQQVQRASAELELKANG